MTTILTNVYRQWQSLRLPWRKRWLAGTDLSGNKYYYFRPTLSTTPSPDNTNLRRILTPSSSLAAASHYSDISISPAWHQWLRHTRVDPPSLAEQHADVSRQAQLKQLVKRADERWEAKGRLTGRDPQRRGNAEIGIGDGEGVTGRLGQGGTISKTENAEIKGEAENEKQKTKDERANARQARERSDPWKRNTGAPGETYQPEAWQPADPPVKRPDR